MKSQKLTKIQVFFALSCSAVFAAAPSGVRAIPGNGMVTLVWNRVAGATNYKVYRSTTSGNTGTSLLNANVLPAAVPNIKQANGFFSSDSAVSVWDNKTTVQLFCVDFADTTVANGTKYYYQVTAGTDATKSAEVNATPVATTTTIVKNRFLKILPLGNSITSGYDGPNNAGGYRTNLYDSLTKGGYNFLLVGSFTRQSAAGMVDPYHEGWNSRAIGDLTRGVVDRAIKNFRPDIVILEIGTNDFNSGATSIAEKNVPNFLAQYDTLASRIYALNPQTTLLLVPLPEWCFTQFASEINAMKPKIYQFNAGLKTLAQKYTTAGKSALYMNTMEGILTNDTVGGDCLHPGSSEYGRMGNLLYAGIKSITGASVDVKSSFGKQPVAGVEIGNSTLGISLFTIQGKRISKSFGKSALVLKRNQSGNLSRVIIFNYHNSN